jgi:rubredoxin
MRGFQQTENTPIKCSLGLTNPGISGRHGHLRSADYPGFVFIMNKLICKTKEIIGMDKYVCTVCGYVYDPEAGDPDNDVDPGTKFEALPDSWVCPICGASKDDFEKED